MRFFLYFNSVEWIRLNPRPHDPPSCALKNATKTGFTGFFYFNYTDIAVYFSSKRHYFIGKISENMGFLALKTLASGA